MYDKVRQHDDAINDHTERILNLEEADKRHEARLKLLEDNAIRLENTVMSEARETRSTMERNTDRLYDIVENAMTISATQETQRHELKLTKWDKVTTILLKAGGGLVGLASAGGAIYYMIDHFLNK
ncbi:hypothetical protein ACFQ38_01715 [Sporosarcina contaminans]|uniref:Haemolysin XhlA n=1 Tax=Sporosarcina contaminans TaxID=633403 RepID=A0ABW3TTD5_9BACL